MIWDKSILRGCHDRCDEHLSAEALLEKSRNSSLGSMMLSMFADTPDLCEQEGCLMQGHMTGSNWSQGLRHMWALLQGIAPILLSHSRLTYWMNAGSSAKLA